MNIGKHIIIVQSGWVFIGDTTVTPEGYTCTNLYNVRKWGTTRGLGQLALEGVTKETILEPYGEGFFPTHAVIGVIKCK